MIDRLIVCHSNEDRNISDPLENKLIHHGINNQLAVSNESKIDTSTRNLKLNDDEDGEHIVKTIVGQ